MNDRKTSREKLIDVFNSLVLLVYIHAAMVLHLEHVHEWPPLALVVSFAGAFGAWHFTEKLVQRLFLHDSSRASETTERVA